MKPSKLAALALSALLMTGCATAQPEPTLEDAGKACVSYVMLEKDADRDLADRACEIQYEELGESGFIEDWTP